MIKDLKGRLQEEMLKRKIRVPKMATILNIPKDRIYAWYRDDSNPKGEDSDKIEEWLNGDNSNKIEDFHLNEPKVAYGKGNVEAESANESLVAVIKLQAETIKSQQETIFYLTTKGKAKAAST